MIFLLVGCSGSDSDSDSKKKTVRCEACDAKNESGAKYCQECGARLNSSGSSGSNNDTTVNEDKWLLKESYVPDTGVTIKYFYDENGYLVGQESWGSDGKIRMQSFFTNDSYGNCTEEYIPLYENLGFDSRINYRNTYDTKGRLTESHNEDWNTYDKYYYEGDELVKKVHIDEDGKEYYDEYRDGRLVVSFRGDSSVGSEDTVIELFYDGNGKCTGTSVDYIKADEYGNITADKMETHTYITLEDYLEQNLHVNDYAQRNNGGSSNGGTSNGGSSNGGTSSSGGSSSKPNTTVCTVCSGTGQGNECIGCDGKGEALSYYDINHNPVYMTCIACKGSGYGICPYCGGDGLR